VPLVRGTEVLPVDPMAPDRASIERAAEVIRDGGLVAFPTETVYGLGANGLDGEAVRRIFRAKGRPADNPLILHFAALEAVLPVVREVPDWAREVARRFWPGPLTLVLKRARLVPAVVTAGLDTVAVRVPDNVIALQLIRAAGVPIAAPSANLSGKPSPTTAEHVVADLAGKIEMILDGGPTGIGVESTVLDASGGRPRILRPGGVSREALEEVLGPLEEPVTASDRPRSPGMKYTHYSPDATLYLVEHPNRERVARTVGELARRFLAEGRRVGIIAGAEHVDEYLALAGHGWLTVMSLGREDREVAANLFAALRAMDERGVEVLICEGYPETGLGYAVMNRLRKAADRIITSDAADFNEKGQS